MHYRVEHHKEIEAELLKLCQDDPFISGDSDELERDLRTHPHRAGVQLESGLYSARRGRLSVLYDVSDDDLIVRILAVKDSPNKHQLVRSRTYTDQLDSLRKSIKTGTVLPEADSLEALIHRDPREVGSRTEKDHYETTHGRVSVIYSVKDHPPIIELLAVRYLD